MRNLNQIRWSARMLCLSLTCLWPLLAGNELPGKAPRVRTVSPGPLKPLPVHRRTHPIRGGITGGAGTISPPVSPVSLLRTSAGALGLYKVAGDASKSDFATNHGGPLVVSAQLELIFWGSAWQPAVNPSSNQVVTAVQSILSGPYLSQMRQYGYQSVTLRGVTYATSNPPVNYTSDDANTLVWNLIDSGAFPEPDEPGGRILYMVVMPPGTVAPGNYLGAHGDPWDYDFPADVDWAWVGWVGYGNLNTITKVLSHELVEAISDPEPDTPAWTLDKSLNGGNEIGDACNNTSDFWNGILLQAYWSEQYKACVLPLGSGQPVINSLNVKSGPVSGGTTVVIQGRLLANAQKVAFGGMPAASFRVDSMTQITAVSPVFDSDLYPNGPRVFDVVVTTPFGQSVTGTAGKFSYYPVITSVTPAMGSMLGGDVIDVAGEGFQPTRATSMRFDNAISTNVYCGSTMHCTVLTPSHGPGRVNVFANVDGVESLPSAADQYLYSGPLITAISPAAGPEEGGTYVHLTGFAFDDTMRVRFGSTWSAYVVCQDGTRCTTRSPGGKGAVNIIANLGGVESPATAANLFRYAPFPAIHSLTPARGPATGGTAVTITGLNFSIAPGATTVHFGSAAASNVHCTTTQLCMATTPPGISIVHVTVTVAGLTSVTPALFSYVPVVTSVTPNKGPETGRTTVTITGAGFASTQFSSYPSVAFGSNATLAPPYCPTATSCIVASPAGIGVVDVFVTVDGQTSSATLADHFTYAPAGAARGWTQWNLSIFAPGALAYDTIRHAALAYAWTLDTGAQTFTWSAAGTPSWMAHNPVSSPQVGEPMMAFDEARGKAVLFGGLFVQSPGPPPVVHPVADTWLWDGSNWQQLALTTFPSRRVRGSMVFDGARQKIVLFGGCSDNACASLLNDTWTFDGTAWTREQPANSPPARHNAVMAYDPVNATIVLFGGATASGITNDQWTWNGVNWIQNSPAVVPAARQRAGMAYSRRDGGLVLFGGAGLGINLNDTWIWNGIQWTQSHPASSPDGGSPVEGMTYDSALDLDVVLLGGGTWTWGGN